MEVELEGLLVFLVLCSAVGLFIDGMRGLIFGLLLGPIGLVVSAVLSVKK